MLSSQVKTFLAVAEAGSFTRAAQKLYITPTSVMHQINTLEETVGVLLFARSKQGVKLTTAGQAFFQDAQRLQREAMQAMERVRKLREKQVIRVGSSLLNPCHELLEIWEKMDHQVEQFELEVVSFEDTNQTILSKLDALGQEMDCFIGVNGSIRWREHAGFLQLGTYPLRIAVPMRHRLYDKQHLRSEDLQGERIMIVARGDTPIVDQLRDDLLALKNPPSFVDAPFFYDLSIFNECVKSGTLLVYAHMEDALHPSMRVMPVSWPYCLPYGVIYAKEPSEKVRLFVKNVQEARVLSKMK